MDETLPKDMRLLFESLQNTMLQLLDLSPCEGWFWITEAQRRVLKMQMESVLEKPEPKAG